MELKGNRGLSLLEVLISIGVLSIAVTAFNKAMTIRLNGIAEAQVKTDVLALRHSIRESFSCEETFVDRNLCSSPQRIELRSKTGSKIVGIEGTNIGNFTLKAQCDDVNNIFVKYEYRGELSLSGQKLLDRDLFNGIPLSCAQQIDRSCNIALKRPTKTCESYCYDFNIGNSGFGGGILKENPILQISGNAAGWEVEVNTEYAHHPLTSFCGGATKCEKKYMGVNQPMKYATYSISNSGYYNASSDVSQIPLVKFLPSMARDWFDRKAFIKVREVDGFGRHTGESCTLQIYQNSPLVLHFPKLGPFSTVNVLDSSVQFDLMSTGKKVTTGWIAPSSALLVLDLNDNGLIDDGRELFGEATLLPNGKTAENGFFALKQYVEDGVSVLSKDNKIFGRLKLWFDENQDGISQEDELKLLDEMGVTKIELNYSVVPKYNNGNNVSLRAKFYSEIHCPSNGCTIYDVYFRNFSSTKNNILDEKNLREE